ncbi:MAG: sugar transferase [Chloroflexota bacterium]
MAKRAFDLLAGGVLLLIVAPVMGAVALALKLEGRVPVWRRTPRVGRGGATFHMLSFSTMVDAAHAAPGATPESRETAVGRIVRNYSLDHLPMLWHVARGDMSLIGPRPMEPELVDLSDPAWQHILSVRPGAASYAILRLARTYNRSAMAERQRLELEYVDRRSLRFDLALCGEVMRAKIASRGNIKARGEPAIGRTR